VANVGVATTEVPSLAMNDEVPTPDTGSEKTTRKLSAVRPWVIADDAVRVIDVMVGATVSTR
jgi:hypothetical protein